MFEVIFTIIGGVIYGAWLLLKKTWPILLTLFAASFVISIGVAIREAIAEAPIRDKYEEYSHTVKVYWDEDATEYETFYVREDLNWVLDEDILYNDYVSSYPDLYSVKNYESVDLPDEVEYSGRKFLGLFTDPYGIEQYVDQNGYSLKNVKSDITLYALWE